MKMQGMKQTISIKRTPLLRIAALVAAVVILGVLLYTVEKRAGNPAMAWYTARKIAAHYNSYHSGEGYVVGPAEYRYASIEAQQPASMRYLCRVYKTGSVDTGFNAFFKDGAVIGCESATTKSGANTYNRLKNALNAELASSGVLDALSVEDTSSLFADFYEPDSARKLFDLDAPVFVPDMPYDRASLPLQSVVCLTRFFTDVAEVTDAALAQELYALKTACESADQPFTVYSVQLYSSTGYALSGLDVPSAALATPEDAVAYVTAIHGTEKANPPPNFYAATVAMRKYDWLYNQSNFEVCIHP